MEKKRYGQNRMGVWNSRPNLNGCSTKEEEDHEASRLGS
jgi:hypothetical protein